MTDNHSTMVRSYNMSKIKSKNNKPEIAVRKYLFRKGFRYRINVKELPGCPDIVLPKYNTVIFVNGCFWHMHETCGKFRWPKSNTDYWHDKITKNVERDSYNYSELMRMGWRVIIVWECEIKKTNFENRMLEVINLILAN